MDRRKMNPLVNPISIISQRKAYESFSDSLNSKHNLVNDEIIVTNPKYLNLNFNLPKINKI